MAIPSEETEIPLYDDVNGDDSHYQNTSSSSENAQNSPSPPHVSKSKDLPSLLATRKGRIGLGSLLTVLLLIFVLILSSLSSTTKSTTQSVIQETSSPTSYHKNTFSNTLSIYFPAGDYEETMNHKSEVLDLFPLLLEDSIGRLSIEVNDLNVSVMTIRKGSVIIDMNIETSNDFMRVYQTKSLQESLEQSFSLTYFEAITETTTEWKQYLGVTVQVYLQKFTIPTPAPILPTYSPTLSPSTATPTISGPTTAYPTEFPTTPHPTTVAPTKFPTTSPTTNPTKFPTASPTKKPTRTPTTNPTEFPTPNPVNLVIEAEYTCDQVEAVHDVFFLNILQDNNLGDVLLDTDGYLKPIFTKNIESLVKHRADSFRTAHPNEQLSQLGLLFGKYPHAGLQTLVTGHDYKFNLVSILKECGYTTAVFGLWHESDSLLTRLNVDYSFRSSNPLKVKESLVSYISNHGVFNYGSKHLVLVWWPKADVYNDIGAKYSEVHNVYNNYVYGVSGVSDRFGDVCKDIVRDDDDSFFRLLSDGTRRYDVCSRQVHIANQKLLLEFIGEVSTIVKEKSSKDVNSFIALTSTSGPESYAVNPSQETKSSFRGAKSSLYDGGLRVPFYYNSFIYRRPVSFADYDLEGLSPLQVQSAMNGVDLLPTILDLAGVTLNQVLESHFDGEKVFDFLKKERKQAISRKTMQVYQYEHTTLDNCKMDSPNYAIIDNYGRYKLLVEPPVGTAMLPKFLDGAGVVELYDLEYSAFESINWMNTEAASTTFSNNLRFVAESLYTTLRKTVKDNQFTVSETKTQSGCNDIFKTTSTASKSIETDTEVKGIIIILADDMGQSDASIYGKLQKNLRDRNNTFFMSETPHIDRIAEHGGYVFTDFYSNSAVCSPSRAALLTAKYPSHVFNRIHSAVPQEQRYAATKGVASYLGEYRRDEHFNMNTFFKSQGYVTGHFGKWHLGFNGPTVDDSMYGIDQYQVYASTDFPDEKKTVNFPTSRNPSKYYKTEFDNSDLFFPSESSNLIIERTMEFIEERLQFNEKFVVNVWLQNAHAPLNLAQDIDEIAKYNFSLAENRASSLRRTLQEGKLETGLEVYRTLLAAQDEAVGKLLDYLQETALIDNTAIFYSSDNGAESTDKYFHSVGNTFSHFRGYKRSLYEGGLRVPGLFHFGKMDKDAGATIISTPSSLIDLFPTLVSLAGLTQQLEIALAQKSLGSSFSPVVHELQGRDLSCHFTGKQSCFDNDSIQRNSIIFEWRETNSGGDCLGWSGRFALRYKNYKLHLEPKERNRRVLRSNKNLDTEYLRIEFYNVVEDPAEMTNLWLTQRGNFTVVSLVHNLVEHLAQFTQEEAYDTTLFPNNRKQNLDYSTGEFPVGYLCEPEIVTNVRSSNSLPWIPSSYLSDFVS